MSISLKEQGIRAFLWDFAGKIALQGTGFIISIFLARLLEPSDFGTLAMVMVILGIAGIFSDVGLSGALVQRRRVLPIHYNSVFFFNIAIALILTIITFLSAPFIADFYNNEKLLLLTQVISVSFVLNALNTVHIAQFRKNLNYKVLTQITLFSSVSSGLLGVLFAYFGFGIWSLVIQQLFSNILSVILVWYFSTWRPSLIFSFKALVQLWGFGFRMFLAALLDGIFTRLDYIIIGKLFTPAILGFFQRAKSLDMLIVSYSSGSLMRVLFPLLSKVQNDLPRFRNIIVKSLGIICFVVFFLLGFFFLVSHELIIILFTEKWELSVEYFKILVLSGFAYHISALLVNVLSSRGNSKAFLRLEIYKKIIFATNLLVGFIWGIKGYLYGLVIASALAVYLNIIFASNEIGLLKWKLVKPIFIQSLIGIFSVCLVLLFNWVLFESNFLNFIMKGTEYLIFYMGLNFLLKTESYQYFIQQFPSLFKKVEKND